MTLLSRILPSIIVLFALPAIAENELANGKLSQAWISFEIGSVLNSAEALQQYYAVCQIQENCSDQSIDSAEELYQILCLSNQREAEFHLDC